MRKVNWCAWVLCGLMTVALGCAQQPSGPAAPATNTAKGSRPAAKQQGSTTGGGTEVPMPATEQPSTTETPATPAEPAPEKADENKSKDEAAEKPQ